ncbi:hypothetical protein AgCh_016200 [Apium graveolens]
MHGSTTFDPVDSYPWLDFLLVLFQKRFRFFSSSCSLVGFPCPFGNLLNRSVFIWLCLYDLMETKGGRKKSSSTIFYEAPLGYSIEDVRPHGGIKKFKSAAYSNFARKPS